MGELESHRRELLVHCYRMLGSFTDAEDVVQETLVAAWRGLPGFEGRSSLRTWLYRIATNRCLNAIRDKPAEPVPPFDPPEPTRRGEVTWLQPFPDDPRDDPQLQTERRATIELAFIVALQSLPPRQTATLVLRDVLGFTTAETAEMLGTTPTVVKGLLQRARASLGQRKPMPGAGSPEEQAAAQRFAELFAANDIDGVVGLLTDDAWLVMPPAPHEYQGREAIMAFLRARGERRIELVPARANTQPAFLCSDGGMIVLTLDGPRISRITRFLDFGCMFYNKAPVPPDWWPR